jgi:hypothetical protein
VAVGEGTLAHLLATLRALELEPATDDPLLARLRAVLGEEDGIERLWSLEDTALRERLDRTRTRLASAEGREVAGRATWPWTTSGAPPRPLRRIRRHA